LPPSPIREEDVVKYFLTKQLNYYLAALANLFDYSFIPAEEKNNHSYTFSAILTCQRAG
jgi:hypothetical protein